jgi:hypothetical protein
MEIHRLFQQQLFRKVVGTLVVRKYKYFRQIQLELGEGI